MATQAAQFKEVGRYLVKSKKVIKSLKNTHRWEKAGELAGQKLMKLLSSKKKSLKGTEVILSFEPMVACKYVLDEFLKAKTRQGVVLHRTLDARRSSK